MSSINNITNQKDLHIAMSEINLGPHNSVQFMFAKLQLAQSEICKNNAEAYMEKIEQAQQEQKECAEMIAMARECQQKGKDGQGKGMMKSNGNKVTSDDAYPMPQELVDYMDKHGLDYPNADNDHTLWPDEWDYALKSLTNYQETLGTSTQTDMVYLQDYMSQYNAFLQGANSAIQDSTDTVTTILRG